MEHEMEAGSFESWDSVLNESRRHRVTSLFFAADLTCFSR